MKKSLLLIVLNIFVLLPFYSQTLSDSLVAHYFLDANGVDSVGSNNGTINGATLTSDRNSNLNSAYLFNGAGDWVNIGNYPDLAITGDLTVSAWVKTPTSWPTAVSDPMIYVRNTDFVTQVTGVNLFISKSHLPAERKFSFIARTPTNSWGDDWVLGTTVAQLNTWYFVVGIREGNQMKIYVNGILENSDVGITGAIDYGTNPMASIGEKDGTSQHWFKGVIDDVRIYKRALSANEVQTLYTTISSVSHNDNHNSQILIYPNPSHNFLNIDNTNNDIQISRVEVYNVSGQKVHFQSFKSVIGNVKIDISDLIDGTYFIKIFDAENDFTAMKFLKLKE